MSRSAEVALDFLRCFWAGDIEAAGALCTHDAHWVFARSLPYSGTVPIAEGLRTIVDGLFSQFDPPGRFDVRVHHALADGDVVLVEYSASGRLQNGATYENDYVASIRLREGRVAELRIHTDTLHLSRLFGS
jgi:ketosteroid isomerase-like protein